MVEKKKVPQIVFLERWYEIIVNEMTEEEAGKIIKAAYEYFFKGIQPTFSDRFMRSFWNDLKKWLDDDKAHYIKQCRDNQIKIQTYWLLKKGIITQAEYDTIQRNTDEYERILKKKGVYLDNDNDKAQSPKPNDNDKAQSPNNNPSNIQATSIITEGAEKSAAAQPAPAQNAEPAAGNGVTVSLDGWKGKDPQREAEAMRINPGNFKKHYRGAADLDGETVFRLCDLRRDMIRSGADPDQVDRGIQNEINNKTSGA